MTLKAYPGDRGSVWLEEDDVELAKLWLSEGKTSVEVLREFKANGYDTFKAADITYFARKELRER